MVAGFALAGFQLGGFTHLWSQTGAEGTEAAPYGVTILSEGVTSAALIPGMNFSNWSAFSGAGPCSALAANGTNMLNSTGAASAFNLSSPNATSGQAGNATSFQGSLTMVCLNAVNNANISELWGAFANQSLWDNVSAPANATFGMTNFTFNASLGNLTGNANLSGVWDNVTGCSPVTNNTSLESNCQWFAENSNTTFLPHAGFYASNGTWVPNPTLWHPNQTGFRPGDQVYYATVHFNNSVPGNTTYEITLDMEGATPIPQVFFVNSGAGGLNETVTFVFDMTLAWNTAQQQFGNASALYVVAQISTVSLVVSQCLIDATTNAAVCPDTQGGPSFP